MIAALLLVGLLTIRGSHAAFTASTGNGINHLAAGTITVGDDDNGSVLFDLPTMTPGSPEVRCINVVYTGSVVADIRMLAAVDGGFAPYLRTTIDVGTGAGGGPAFDCAGFVASPTSASGTLADLGTTTAAYAGGLRGFSPVTAGATRSYRITVDMADDAAAIGQTATATFAWEARPT